MIRVTDSIALDESEIEECFLRASGPGGQNVNKLASAVQLRFDVEQSPNLPTSVRERLKRQAGQRLTRQGVLVITAQRFRSQHRNREDAVQRLISMIRAAAEAPKRRLPTRPPSASRRRRLDHKRRRGAIKRLRRSVSYPD